MGWKVNVRQAGTQIETNDDSGDAFRYRRPGAAGVEESPCTAECGCPDSKWCSGAMGSTLRIVPDLGAATTRGHFSESPRVAEPNQSDDRMRYAGMRDAGMNDAGM